MEIAFEDFTDDVSTLFDDVGEETQESQEKNEKNSEENNKETTELNPDDLFGETESVGSGEKNTKEKEDTETTGQGTSQNNFFSSIAKALQDEGIFPDLDDDALSKVEKAEDFRDLVEQQIKANLTERQKRIDDALNANIEPTEIKKYENIINYLDGIKEENITKEGDEGEELRKNLIYQDFVNRGYSRERALREVEKSFKSGSDIEDAKEALTSNTNFFNQKYDDLVNDAKQKQEEKVKEQKEQAEKLKTSILKDKSFFGDITLDDATRKTIYNNVAKPVFKDPETGEYLTAIQKYERDNKQDFLKNLGLIFTLTDGFKSLDKLVGGKVKREVKKGLKELEHTINNTARTNDGNLKFVNNDSESYIPKGFKFDI